MKKLQPEMEKIRERFKDDRVKQQQEMMTLYKNQKINPISGCLPTVVQIPVFFALYKVLFVTIDMRHAPFFGWIKDLSAPDPTSVFNLFGLLAYHPPAFLMVGAWPIIMGCTMFMQMQLNPQQPDPVQQKIFTWMPVIFTFMLASFPSGLVIYWAWNNVLSLVQQYTIMRRNNAEVHLWKNLGADQWKTRLSGLKTRLAGADRSSLQQLASAAQSLPQRIAKMLPWGGPATSARDGEPPMTRDEALSTLGLRPGASEREIDAALDAEQRRRQSGHAGQKGQQGLNGSEQAMRARHDAAREKLRGKQD
jgi:YidC/Oxa1 family membrane protein insertase